MESCEFVEFGKTYDVYRRNPNGTLVISLSRSFYEVFGGKYTGIVEVQQHYNVFENIISRSVIGPNSGTKATVKTYVYNDLGQQVYPYVDPIIPSNTPNYYNYVSGNLADYSILPIPTNDCKQILAFSKSDNTKKIHRSISNLNLESLSTPEPFNRNTGTYELEVLNDAYVSMVSLLEQSFNDAVTAKSHEVQAQMLALQAQMNPHFLYNTITVMSIKAEKSNQPELANMCENLTHMLRYIARDSATLGNSGQR
ncbi:MAG: sensor histidine kinase [Cellulosilyticaceae bacterium]